MRVVSMVPSLTETCVEAGLDMVGRTRYCIHPADKLQSVPIVGGTKNWDRSLIAELDADILLLDRDENPLFMSEESPISWFATQVDGIEQMPATMRALSIRLQSTALHQQAERWQRVMNLLPHRAPMSASLDPCFLDGGRLPGLMDWGQMPQQPVKTVLYMIWKDPWMVAGRNSFIGSMLDAVGLTVPHFANKYEQIDLTAYPAQSTLLLFASEPFPFLEKRDEVAGLGYPHAFVDGESFSWFGIRALRFLENIFSQGAT